MIWQAKLAIRWRPMARSGKQSEKVGFTNEPFSPAYYTLQFLESETYLYHAPFLPRG
jgi:hypothetical protein